MTCDHYRDLLWDDLYGLLEAGESEALRGHVASCPTCQIELQKAETGQRLLSKAARLDEILIPPFIMPVPAAETATVPITTVNHQPALARRRLRVLPWLAAAAAALVLILLPYGFYQHGLAQREAAYRSSERELQTVLAERQTAKQQADDDLKAAEAAARAGQLRVQVLGPPAYQPGALNQYHVQATNLSGAGVHATVRARLLDDKKRVLFEEKFTDHSQLVVTLPSALPLAPSAAARLEFIATGPNAEAVLQEQIPVLAPKYATQLVLDKTVYHPGETIFFRSLTLERFTHKPPGRPLELAYKLYDPRSMTRIVAKGTTRPDGRGSGELDLSANAISGEYKLNVTELKNVFAPVTRSIWVQPAGDKTPRPMESEPTPKKRTVDFFPEGGDLVAGLSSRVYFHVHGLGNAAVKGQVIDGQDGVVAEVQTAPSATGKDNGFGVFSFTPQRGESYRLRIGAGRGEPLTVGLPAARSEGVVLSAPTPVSKEGDVLRLLLAATAERQLLIGVSCRGNLVAQEAVTVGPGVQEVVLHPAAVASGLLRATAFEVQANRLQPLAERLVYRLPTERLALSVTTDKKQYRPGDKVQLTVRSDNEKGQPQSAWLSVSVVDQDAWSQARGHSGPSLPAYFQLAAGLDHPEDVEQANLPLDDDPQSRGALDFFLATHSRRNFAEAQPGESIAAGPRLEGADTPLLVLDNLNDAQKRYTAAVSLAAKNVQDAFGSRMVSLNRDGERLLRASRDAADDLSAYRDRAGSYARLALTSIALAGLGAGAVCLVVALLGFGRGTYAPRPYLAGAFASLLLSFLALPLARTIGETPPDFAGLDALARDLGNMPGTPQVAQVARSASGSARSADFPGNVPIMTIGTEGPGGNTGSAVRMELLPVREYAYLPGRKPGEAGNRSHDTLLWYPLLSDRSRAGLILRLPERPGVYRVRVEGHDAAGRLGATEATIQVAN